MADHIGGYQNRDRKANGTRWLWSDPNGVDQSVNDPRHATNTNQINGHPWQRIGQDVDEGDQQQWNNVLQVVSVCSTYSFDARIAKDDFVQIVQSSILDVGISL